ncbi:MAG TPA: ATP-binding protein [Anaeromyxobacteraceae bacterium]|nr:ATP-binding protein [Anaeromyxobacteraceae bacterium]
MVRRPSLQQALRTALGRSRVVALIGPRQCGKTTLARALVPARSPGYFDLEDPQAAARLDQPMTALAPLRGVVVIDEIQRRPDLFEVLRVLADRRPLPARFLVLGSASPELVRRASESLAGRLETVTMAGFSLAEVGGAKLGRLWLRGGFPPSFLARSQPDSVAWRREFIRTFLERDLPLSGVRVPATTMHRFWTMLAHWHGGVWNGSELARAFGVSEPSVRRYLDLLSGLFMVRQVQPWHENLSKRQVKAPKVYVRDSGLLHQLLGIRDERDLLAHPKVGASWEGFAMEEAIRAAAPDEAYFWATHAGAELDLLLFKDGRRIGVEAKRVDAPVMTRSMRVALADLRLDRLVVLHPGDRRFSLGPLAEAVPLRALATEGGAALLPGKRRR